MVPGWPPARLAHLGTTERTLARLGMDPVLGSV